MFEYISNYLLETFTQDEIETKISEKKLKSQYESAIMVHEWDNRCLSMRTLIKKVVDCRTGNISFKIVQNEYEHVFHPDGEYWTYELYENVDNHPTLHKSMSVDDAFIVEVVRAVANNWDNNQWIQKMFDIFADNMVVNRIITCQIIGDRMFCDVYDKTTVGKELKFKDEVKLTELTSYITNNTIGVIMIDELPCFIDLHTDTDNLFDRVRDPSDKIKNCREEQKKIAAKSQEIGQRIADYKQTDAYIERQKQYQEALKKYNEEKERYQENNEKHKEAIKALIQKTREIEHEYSDRIKALKNAGIMKIQEIKELRDQMKQENEVKAQKIDQQIEKNRQEIKKRKYMIKELQQKKITMASVHKNAKKIEKLQEEEKKLQEERVQWQQEKLEKIEELRRERKEIDATPPQRLSKELNPEHDEVMRGLVEELKEARRQNVQMLQMLEQYKKEVAIMGQQQRDNQKETEQKIQNGTSALVIQKMILSNGH